MCDSYYTAELHTWAKTANTYIEFLLEPYNSSFTG
jgi:hypothetical protein